MKVLNFGSLNIDYVYEVEHFVQAGETLSSLSMKKSAGGKGANQSAAIAKAGIEVYHAGKIGEDGNFILELLRNYGVDVRYVVKTEDASGHAIIQIDADKQNAILLYAGGNRKISLLEIDNVFSNFNRGDWLVIQNEINNLDLIVNKALDIGMHICFNIAPFSKEAMSLPLDKMDLLVVNEIEGAGLAGSDSKDNDEIISSLIKKFPNNKILITLGKAGACYIEKGEITFQEIIDYPVVDTTAAGDTFVGFFLASLLRGHKIRDSLYFASKASGIAVSRKGAMESIPTKEEVFC